MTEPLPRVAVLATGICCGLVALLVWGWIFGGLAEHRRVVLALASTAYLLVAAGHVPQRTLYGCLVFGGLVFCWWGDVIGPGNFQLGAAMFLIAHLFFVPAFLLRARSWEQAAVCCAIALLFTCAVLYGLWPRMEDDARLLMTAYGAVIALMLGAAWACLGRGGAVLIPLGATVFYLSDLFLAQTAFLVGGKVWTVTGYPLYYTACLLLAWSIWKPRADSLA